MARFTRAELASYRGVEVPDLVGPATRLLFVGINPGLRTAATQTHFGKPANRFWPALLEAGIVEERVDVREPMTDETRALCWRAASASPAWCGATARADELTADELREGPAPARPRRPGAPEWWRCSASRRTGPRSAAEGGGRAQPGGIGAAELWVVPNPSGLNAHETVHSLAAAYAEPARAAGIIR